MPGVSSRGPVSAADGFGKVYLKFRPVKKRSWLRTLAGVVVYLSFCLLMTFAVGWSKPSLRENILIPVVHSAIYVVSLFVTFRPNGVFSNKKANLPVENLTSVLGVQGYEHAVSHFVQMEILRRTAYGRMSELFGEQVAEMDSASIAIDFAAIAQRDYELLNDADKLLLEAYSQGVNEYITEVLSASPWSLPLDYVETFGRDRTVTAIDRWLPVHSLAIMRLVSYQWSTGWEDSVLNRVLNRDSSAKDDRTDNYYKSDTVPSMGGTAFVIGGMHTKRGGAVIAASMESLGSYSSGYWVDSCLQSSEIQVCGASMPGIPLVFSGRNEHISWSLLPSAVSFENLINVSNFNNEGTALTERTEMLKVRVGALGNDTLTPLTIKRYSQSSHVSLPMISDIAARQLVKSVGQVSEMALDSPSLSQPINVQFLLQMCKATDWHRFTSAYELNTAMPLNAVYGDALGNIGSAAYQGPGVASLYTHNPQSGHIIAATSHVQSQLGSIRLEILVSQLISSDDKVTAESAQRILSDTFSPSSLQLMRLISDLNLDAIVANKVKQVIITCKSLVAAFDGQYEVTASAPVILEAFRSALVHNFMDSMGAGVANAALSGLSPSPLKRSQSTYRSSQSWVLDMLESPQYSIADRDTLVQTSLYQAFVWCEEHYGSSPSKWRWGNVHKTYFVPRSAPSKWYLLDAALSRGPSPTAGGWDSVQSSQYSLINRLSGRDALYSSSDTYLSSHRMVVDMSPKGNDKGQRCVAMSSDELSSIRSPRFGISVLFGWSGAHEPNFHDVCLLNEHSDMKGSEL